MRILVALTYYRPYTSGLTLYAERVARALLAMGHQVTIVTSRHDPALPAEEVMDGVRVFRANVAFRISKGPVMPGMLFLCWKLMQSANLIHLHLPQLDAAGLAIMGRLLGKRVVSTYHCDLQLPTGIINRMANWGVTLANHIAASLSDRIATNTLDYAEHSSLLRRYLGKVTQIYPPAVIQPPTQADFAAVIKKADIQPDEIIIGMAARLASEKGVEYMIEALPIIQQTYPQARVLFVGAYQNVPGEEMYAQKLAPMIAKLGASWRFLGLLEDREFAAFLSSCAVTVLPSLNSTESFGMVQIESMLCGVPVVTTDLPGVRQPVRLTGMGRIIPKASAQALADAVLDVLEQKKNLQPGQPAPVSQDQLNRLFSPHQVALQYDALFQETL